VTISKSAWLAYLSTAEYDQFLKYLNNFGETEYKEALQSLIKKLKVESIKNDREKERVSICANNDAILIEDQASPNKTSELRKNDLDSGEFYA